MGGFSIWHILIFAIILLLLFGGNRFSAMMGDVAKGLKSFKSGLADEDDKPKAIPPAQQTPEQPPIDVTARPAEPAAPPPPADDQPR